MNEPAPFLQAEAHVASLTESTLRHPMLADSKSKPVFGLTLGMAEILTSREILLLVSGAAKREPLRKLLRREITTHFPASFLWLHPNWTLLCDRESAEGLDVDAMSPTDRPLASILAGQKPLSPSLEPSGQIRSRVEYATNSKRGFVACVDELIAAIRTVSQKRK